MESQLITTVTLLSNKINRHIYLSSLSSSACHSIYVYILLARSMTKIATMTYRTSSQKSLSHALFHQRNVGNKPLCNLKTWTGLKNVTLLIFLSTLPYYFVSVCRLSQQGALTIQCVGGEDTWAPGREGAQEFKLVVFPIECFVMNSLDHVRIHFCNCSSE